MEYPPVIVNNYGYNVGDEAFFVVAFLNIYFLRFAFIRERIRRRKLLILIKPSASA